ncbi:sensor histidine kinase [Roseateles chitinivorans]|uniref:sensor histidine kinase n=1 Tax=Roseateles chitinivorans TaxID=2917965 RepID=UPI003D67A9AD
MAGTRIASEPLRRTARGGGRPGQDRGRRRQPPLQCDTLRPARGRVDIALARQGGQLTIDLRDNGPGVAPADQARIFEPFYRGERQPDDALKGTGIGLSIVTEYIAAHGGHIDLLPADQGAHFRITLPCAHTPRFLKSSNA